jgi:hypothetical protein
VIGCLPTQSFCVGSVCSSVCDQDAIILGNRTESKKVTTKCVHRVICISWSCVMKCVQCVELSARDYF